MKILIIGSGGREHALAWKSAQSTGVEHVFVAPGNGGTALEDKVTNVEIDVLDFDSLIGFAKKNQISLTIVGPEAPIAAGIKDAFDKAGLSCFAPTQRAAQLESSKTFSKDFMIRHNIPTAHYDSFVEAEAAKNYIREQGTPIVIKADGLAAGKGVIIAQNQQHAFYTIDSMLAGNAFGEAGHRVVIEEFLEGTEASFIVMSDGEHILPLATSQDHKTRDNGNKGPNTGGMGAYSPTPTITEALHEKIIAQVVEPTVNGMKNDGVPYTGFLYAGLMITNQGEIKVLEYNCRFGDPETQPILMRLKSDIIEMCLAAVNQTLNNLTLKWDPRPALGVILAARGYPEKYNKGDEILGLSQDDKPNIKIFHGGTIQQGDKIMTNGGRVLCVTALGNTLNEAHVTAYQKAKAIHWEGVYYRTDIGV